MDVSSAFYREFVYYPVASYTAGPVRRHLKALLASQYDLPLARAEFQASAVRELIDASRREVPYFRTLPELPEAASTPGELLAGIPLLAKSDLQNSALRLRTTVDCGRLVSKTTGGSTGEPVTIWKTRDAWARELGATWRGYAWAGIEVGDLQARFWGVAHTSSGRWRARLIDRVCHRIRIPAFAFVDSDLANYVKLLNRRQPRWYYGYVSMLTELARFVQRGGARLRHRPRCIVTTSEVLNAADRELLREVFGAPVFNEYGCGELGTIAHECPYGSLHVSEENMIVEVLDGTEPCDPGRAGELVVTELNNRAFPLIRYRTGDFGVLAAGTCACGRTLGRLDQIHGRAYDFIRNREGRLFHGEFLMYVFEDLRRHGADIRQFQVEQVDLDRFDVRIVRGDSYDPDCEDEIKNCLRSNVDPDAVVTVEYVESIPRERSGKMRTIKGLPR
ncbi:MAG: phenylacetate--CoA ligase family protein [Betaproteobacteria bacterium]|nr:phenylacetate--CoA ligase family protein [Betaproteobacteria bacterium]